MRSNTLDTVLTSKEPACQRAFYNNLLVHGSPSIRLAAADFRRRHDTAERSSTDCGSRAAVHARRRHATGRAWLRWRPNRARQRHACATPIRSEMVDFDNREAGAQQSPYPAYLAQSPTNRPALDPANWLWPSPSSCRTENDSVISVDVCDLPAAWPRWLVVCIVFPRPSTVKGTQGRHLR